MGEPSSVDPALELIGVTKAFSSGLLGRRRSVLDGVELTIQPGERWGLVGPNGSGKSTLLRLAAGIEKPTRGSLRVFGASLESFDIRRRIGYVPDGFPFPRDLRAARALELIGVVAGLAPGAASKRAKELLERVGLLHAAGAKLGTFSHGMGQRFAIAQAFVVDADLLLFDEPMAGLDAGGCAILEELSREADERGATSLVCSHLVGDLVAHADRLAVLVDGHLRLAGTVGDLAWRGRVLRVELEGVNEASWPALMAAVESTGGRIVGRAPSSRALLELFGTP